MANTKSDRWQPPRFQVVDDVPGGDDDELDTGLTDDEITALLSEPRGEGEEAPNG